MQKCLSEFEEFSIDSDDLDEVAVIIDQRVKEIESRDGKIEDIETNSSTTYKVRIVWSKSS